MLNIGTIHHSPFKVCSGTPSPGCSQFQELLSYTVLLYVLKIHWEECLEALCSGKVVRKNTLFLRLLVLMTQNAPGENRAVIAGNVWHSYCPQSSQTDRGRTGSLLPHTQTKQRLWMKAFISVWVAVAKCPDHLYIPAPPRVAERTLPARVPHFPPTWASTQSVITQEDGKINNWGLFFLLSYEYWVFQLWNLRNFLHIPSESCQNQYFSKSCLSWLGQQNFTIGFIEKKKKREILIGMGL